MNPSSSSSSSNPITVAGVNLEQLLVASTIGAVVGLAIGETLKSAARVWVRPSRRR